MVRGESSRRSTPPPGRSRLPQSTGATRIPRTLSRYDVAIVILPMCVVVVVYHVTIVAFGHGLLKKFWPFW